MKNGTKVIGYFGVDSGQVIIIDPCYLSDWKDGEAFPENGKENSYSKSCKITLGKDRGGEILVADIAGNGVVASTGLGDGNYPVVATYKDGNIKELKIEFF